MARFGKEKFSRTTNYEHRIAEYLTEKTSATLREIVDYLGIAAYNLKKPIERMISNGELEALKPKSSFHKTKCIYVLTNNGHKRYVNY